MDLTTSAHEAFRRHVLDQYPDEACGLLVGKKFVKSRNLADNRQLSFRIDPELLVKYEGKITAILHSHPYALEDQLKWDPVWPSSTDMATWIRDGIPWGIVSTDGEGISAVLWMDDSERKPLLERDFIHGVQDCYAVVRDYFWGKGVELPNYARSMDWWDNGQDLYSQNFQSAGFVPIPKAEAKTGDVILIQVRSPVINHAGVITGDDTFIHHMLHRLSHVDSLRKWDKHIVKYLRY